MQLSKVVSAILNDLSTAQCLANEYSSRLSTKYKKIDRGKSGNTLSNFRVPATALSEISLDLKFVIQEVSARGVSLDVDKTWRNCNDIALWCIAFLYHEVTNLAGSIEIVREVFASVFFQTLEVEISRVLFNLCERCLTAKNKLTRDEMHSVIVNKLEAELFNYKAIQGIKQLHIHVDYSSDDLIHELSWVNEGRETLKKICLSSAQMATEKVDIAEIVQTTTGDVDVDIIISAGDLQNVPTETIQYLHINAKYDNYRWAISEKVFT